MVAGDGASKGGGLCSPKRSLGSDRMGGHRERTLAADFKGGGRRGRPSPWLQRRLSPRPRGFGATRRSREVGGGGWGRGRGVFGSLLRDASAGSAGRDALSGRVSGKVSGLSNLDWTENDNQGGARWGQGRVVGRLSEIEREEARERERERARVRRGATNKTKIMLSSDATV